MLGRQAPSGTCVNASKPLEVQKQRSHLSICSQLLAPHACAVFSCIPNRLLPNVPFQNLVPFDLGPDILNLAKDEPVGPSGYAAAYEARTGALGVGPRSLVEAMALKVELFELP